MFEDTALKNVNMLVGQKNLRLTLYQKAYLIRMAEETIRRIYPTDVMKTPVHLSIGEEGIAAGVCAALEHKDQIYGTYRSHAIYLAKGGDLKAFFGELYGRQSGVAGGKAGSMHLSHPESGFMMSSAVVSTIVPVAVGAAFAAKYNNDDHITAVFFGDGATEEGVFWESLNIASLYRLPVLFICENNGLAIHAPIRDRQRYDITQAARLFGHTVFESSETDAFQIHGIAKNARRLAVENSRPVFLHLKYHRYLEHVGINEDYCFGYRCKEAFADWYERDPIRLQRRNLLQLGVTENVLAGLEARIDALIAEAVQCAGNDSEPAVCEVERDVFS